MYSVISFFCIFGPKISFCENITLNVTRFLESIESIYKLFHLFSNDKKSAVKEWME